MKRSRLNPVNSKRRKKKYERNFGEKADWIREQECAVTGSPGTDWNPVVAAHMITRKMGGCGGDKRHLVPMLATVHVDFDDGLLSDAGFEARYLVSRQYIKTLAPDYETCWQAYREEGTR